MNEQVLLSGKCPFCGRRTESLVAPEYVFITCSSCARISPVKDWNFKPVFQVVYYKHKYRRMVKINGEDNNS